MSPTKKPFERARRYMPDAVADRCARDKERFERELTYTIGRLESALRELKQFQQSNKEFDFFEHGEDYHRGDPQRLENTIQNAVSQINEGFRKLEQRRGMVACAYETLMAVEVAADVELQSDIQDVLDQEEEARQEELAREQYKAKQRCSEHTNNYEACSRHGKWIDPETGKRYCEQHKQLLLVPPASYSEQLITWGGSRKREIFSRLVLAGSYVPPADDSHLETTPDQPAVATVATHQEDPF